MTSNQLTDIYNNYKEKSLFGRYITNAHVEKLLDKLGSKFDISSIGHSVEGRPIYSLKFGCGKTRILLWSQMHGNESTTTKALFDLFNAFNDGKFSDILDKCTLQVIPILSPDGAKRYTRLNANDVDLNRDAQDLSQPESRVLKSCFDDFKPHYCFNLHGQRTIFGVGKTDNSATLSFLSPSEDEARTITDTRKVAMAIIAAIDKAFKVDLPDSIGRYDDGFNINCVGDTFQSLGVPTILYEAGHHANDYQREVTRQYVFKALFYGLDAVSNQNLGSYEPYFDIPENQKNFFDVIVRNCKSSNSEISYDVAIQFKEVLKDNSIDFVPYVEKIGNLDSYFGHREIDANNGIVCDQENNTLEVGREIVFVVLNNRKILIKS